MIKALQGITSAISIDTRKAAVAEVALSAGAKLVNDVSGFQFDAKLLPLCAEKSVPVCVMHSQGLPETMQNNPSYDNIVLDVYDFLHVQIERLVNGVPRSQIIADPGIGFGKTMRHNLALLQKISLFHGLGVAVLLGMSRKGFIGKITGEEDARNRVIGSVAAAMVETRRAYRFSGCMMSKKRAKRLMSGKPYSLEIFMGRTLFGTDGVRGEANKYPMTAEMALRLGAAVGNYFGRQKARSKRVVIGKDTRQSGYMFEYALTAGLTSTGMNALLLGPVPTPAVGLLTTSMRADLGIMVSASHNKFKDNGIKFFGPDGYKLSDQVEEDIEDLLVQDISLAEVKEIGRAQRVDDGLFRYVERVKSTFPQGMRLDGIKVVVDCANGAAYRAAPEALWELGAEVISIGVHPNGKNINEGCGSTHPECAAKAVLEHGADVGLCLDGDADRLILIDEKGQIGDGDQLMGLLASRWASEQKLAGGALVSTVMSNLGLERFSILRYCSFAHPGW